MPNNPIVFPEQKRKSVSFLVAAAMGNLRQVQALCDDYTLNASNSRGNTALHLACEQGHSEILKFLFQQSQINLHLLNAENKKAVDLIKDLSIAELIKEKLNENQEIAKDDLLTINDYVKETVCFGAPNWIQEEFPHQSPTESSMWKKNNPNYYRIDILQEIFLRVKKDMEVILKNDPNTLFIILRIFHSALAESIKVGRCDEQVAVAFNQFLLTEKKAQLIWIQAVNLEGSGGQNFIVINEFDADIEKFDIKKPNSWKKGLLIDPMDDRVENLAETTTKLMGHLTRIISQADAAKIELRAPIALKLPLKVKHQHALVNHLANFKNVFRAIFEDNWDHIWSDISSTIKQEHALLTLPIEEQIVKEWVDLLWISLETKIEQHEALKDKLVMREDTTTRLTQRMDVLLNTESTQMLNALKLG